jgi:AcrR family transcriptional regulator
MASADSGGEVLTIADGVNVPTRQRALPLRAVTTFAHLATHRVATNTNFDIRQVALREVWVALGVPESSFFRYFKTRDCFVGYAYEECWKHINRYLAEAYFEPTHIEGDALSALELDFRRLSDLFSGGDADLKALTTCGLLLHQQMVEDLANIDRGATTMRTQAGRFQERVRRLCDIAGCPDALASDLLPMFTDIWLMWCRRSGKGFSVESFSRLIRECATPRRGDGEEIDLTAAT